jgi:hypothetical protein
VLLLTLQGLRELLPPGSYEKLNGRLRISMTVLTPAPVNLMVDRFESDEDVIEACKYILQVYTDTALTIFRRYSTCTVVLCAKWSAAVVEY